jgi:hypothetical protein
VQAAQAAAPADRAAILPEQASFPEITSFLFLPESDFKTFSTVHDTEKQ